MNRRTIIFASIFLLVAILLTTGIFAISHNIEINNINKAMDGYFTSYKSDFGNLFEGKFRDELDEHYRQNVIETGKRELVKIDKNTYMVNSKKKAPSPTVAVDKAQKQTMSYFLPMAFSETKPSDKEMQNKFYEYLFFEMSQDANKEEFGIKVKIIRENNEWKAVESNGVKLK